jgi:hypothetical protein
MFRIGTALSPSHFYDTDRRLLKWTSARNRGIGVSLQRVQP